MQNKYPLWKNLLLLVIIVIGLVYVIPNLYSEYPVVQITSQSSIEPNKVEAHVKTLLDEAHLPYQKITINDDNIEIRFASTDTQLLARDIIKNGLGNQYTVALISLHLCQVG